MFQTSGICIYGVIKVDPAASTIPAVLSTIIRVSVKYCMYRHVSNLNAEKWNEISWNNNFLKVAVLYFLDFSTRICLADYMKSLTKTNFVKTNCKHDSI